MWKFDGLSIIQFLKLPIILTAEFISKAFIDFYKMFVRREQRNDIAPGIPPYDVHEFVRTRSLLTRVVPFPRDIQSPSINSYFTQHDTLKSCTSLINYIDEHRPIVMYLGTELFVEMQKYNRCVEYKLAPSYFYYFVDQRVKFVLEPNINSRSFATEPHDKRIVNKIEDLN